MSKVTAEDEREIAEFLFAEAELLDEGRLVAWLELLTPDVHYRAFAPQVPVAGQAAPQAPLFEDDLSSIRARVQQLSTPAFTLAENPRSVDRRFVANVRTSPGEREGEFVVRSNLLVRRSRGLATEPILLAGTRRDVLRRGEGGLRLASRTVQLDDAVVPARSLSLFL